MISFLGLRHHTMNLLSWCWKTLMISWKGKKLWFQKCKYGLFSHLVKQPDHFLLLFVGKKKVGAGLQLFLIDNN